MLAEGGLKETIAFLGWFINTLSFTIVFQTEKAMAWTVKSQDIMKMRKGVKNKELHSLIGKLDHVCCIVPDATHFINNLHRTEYLEKLKKKLKLSRSAMNDLNFWLSFLESAEKGISINRVVF